MLVGPVARLLHQLACLLAILRHVRSVARHGGEDLLRQAPHAVGRRLHRAAELGIALVQDVDERLAVHGEIERQPQIRIVERRRVAVQDQVGAVVHRRDLALRRRQLGLDVLQQRDRHFPREGDVEAARHEAQNRRAAVGHDGVVDAVEIRLALLPVVGVARDLDAFVLLELDELEGSGADRLGAHLRRRHVAGVHRRVARGEQRGQRRLRALQVHGDLVVAVGRDLVDVAVPGLARIGAQLVLTLAGQQIEGADHVLGGEGLAVMPLHALLQLERQVLAVGAPRPRLGELGHDRLLAVLGDGLVVDHEIVEHPHHRDDGRVGRRFRGSRASADCRDGTS